MASIDIVINTIDKGSQNAIGFARQFGQAWTELATPLNQTLEIFGKLQDAVGQAFDTLEEGAQVNQITDSFNRMNESVFKTPGLLDAMKQAARGTISEVDAMSGVLTLTAGQSDEMAKRFAEATPRLLEIAKAASALNPTLGDTSFLYESLATGIKRSSPLILDNLGIIVKVGEANEAYAASIGKTVEELTGQEKQIALLNATMEQGSTLIDQAGEGIDAQTDAYQRLGVIAQETGDQIKSAFAEAIAPEIDEIASNAEDLGAAFADVAEMAVPAIKDLAANLPDYVDKMTEAAQKTDEFFESLSAIAEITDAVFKFTGFGILAEFNKTVLGGIRDFAGWAQDNPVVRKLLGLEQETTTRRIYATDQFDTNYFTEAREGAEGATEATEALAVAVEDVGDNATDWPMIYKDLAQQAPEIVVTWQDIKDKEDAAAESAERYAEAIREAEAAMREMTAASGDRFSQAIENLANEDYEFSLGESLYDMADAAGAGASALALLGVQTGEFTQEQAQAAIKMAATNAILEQQGEAIAALGADATKSEIAAIYYEAQQQIAAIGNLEIGVDMNLEPPERTLDDELADFWKREGGGGGGGAGTDATGVQIPIDFEIDEATEELNTFFTETVMPYLDETYTIVVETSGVRDVLDDLQDVINKIDAIDRTIEIEINVVGDPVPE